MRNHIAFKFIAILLCAASLLGAVGSAGCIFLMTEMDLYSKSVDLVYQEHVQNNGEAFAHDKAMTYACSTLGGCPEDLLQDMYPHADGRYFNEQRIGYRLLDSEGNVLDSRELPYGTSFSTHSFDITGQYMHLVDTVVVTTPETQPYDEYAEYQQHLAENAVLINEIPAEGATLSEIQISFRDSSAGSGGENLGTVFCNQDGTVVMRCPGWDIGEETQPVIAIALWDHNGNLIYEASAESGVGTVHYDEDGSGDLIFRSYVAYSPVVTDVVPEETVLETVAPTEVTVPPTEAIPETLPAETAAAAEETVPAEKTAEETSVETVAEEKAEEASGETVAEEKAEEASGETVAEEKAEAASEETVSAASSSEASTEATTEATVPAETAAPVETEAPVVTEPEPTVPETLPVETLPPETVPEEAMPFLINGKTLDSYQINRAEYFDPELDAPVIARYVYVPMPEMTLELYTAPEALNNATMYDVLRVIQSVSRYLFPVLGISALLLAICAVYLCCAAGRKPRSEEVRPGGLNRIPLDLYGLTVFGCIVGLCFTIAEGGEYVLRQNVMVGCGFMAAMAFFACLLIVGFLFACVAQYKTPDGFWWRNSLCGLSLKLCGWLFRKSLQFIVWGEKIASTKVWPLLMRLVRWVFGLIAAAWHWFWGALVRIYQWMYDRFNRFLSLLPVTWQWLLLGMAMVLFLFVTVAARFDFGIVLAILFAFALVLYGAHCFGVLLETTKKMNKGDLDSKVDDKLMVGAFKEFAGDLNDLAGVAVVAAKKQLKSERMKTELITNVSHDIKTPLTSIINYVDLLQKPHTEEEQAQYLEVLDRQSQRLKKLIDDLMEMSKASTGNMTVDVTLVDAVESVNQALGEFSDKLDRAQLTPVFRHTEESVAMMADGRLVWRVLSNLLSNAVKYAMPGTRLYIDLMQLENKVVISLKNISRDELNVDAEELMERFVRGDGSRNTEGSGLGLNIAKSLMELQKGQLQLLVDGDLFKVTLIFPGV